MQTFKEWLISENREIGHSWQDRMGKFHPCMGKSHGDIAQSMGKTIDQMWAEGWFRIIYANNKLYAHNEKMIPNERQKSALIDGAIENHFSHVVYDSGDDERVIWSEFDQL